MFQKLSSLLKSIAGWCTTAASTVNEPGFKQTKTAKRVFLGALVVVVLLLGWIVYSIIAAWTNTSPDPENVTQGEHLLFALAVMGRGAVALVLVFLGLFLSWLLFQILDRTKLGNHLMEWAAKDTEPTEAAKTANGGRIFAACVIGVFILLSQIIR